MRWLEICSDCETHGFRIVLAIPRINCFGQLGCFLCSTDEDKNEKNLIGPQRSVFCSFVRGPTLGSCCLPSPLAHTVELAIASKPVYALAFCLERLRNAGPDSELHWSGSRAVCDKKPSRYDPAASPSRSCGTLHISMRASNQADWLSTGAFLFQSSGDILCGRCQRAELCPLSKSRLPQTDV